MKLKWISALLVVVGSAVYVGNVLATAATPPPDLATTILGQSSLDQFEVSAHSIPPNPWRVRIKTHGTSDVYVVDNKFTKLGVTTGWHSHPGPSIILVVGGAITNYEGSDPSCTGRTYAAGSAFIDPGGNHVHMLRNESNAPAETIAVQLVPHGAQRKIDEPEPANCHL